MIADGFWDCYSIFLLQCWRSSQTVSQSPLTRFWSFRLHMETRTLLISFPIPHLQISYRYLILIFFPLIFTVFYFCPFYLCFKMHLSQINTSHYGYYSSCSCHQVWDIEVYKAKSFIWICENKDMVMGLLKKNALRGVVSGLSSLCLDLWKLYAVVLGKRSLQCALFKWPFSMSALSFSAALVKKRDGMCFWKSYNYHGVISPFNIRLSFVQHVQKA